jgi:hypothetical protein
MKWPQSLLVLLVLGVGAGAAQAHGIESSLRSMDGTADGTGASLELRSSFSTGEPADGAAVSLVSPSADPLPLGTTDAQGTLRFNLPKGVDASYELKVDRGAGHRDYLELPLAGELPLASAVPAASKAAQANRMREPLWRGLLLLGAFGGFQLLRVAGGRRSWLGRRSLFGPRGRG